MVMQRMQRKEQFGRTGFFLSTSSMQSLFKSCHDLCCPCVLRATKLGFLNPLYNDQRLVLRPDLIKHSSFDCAHASFNVTIYPY